MPRAPSVMSSSPRPKANPRNTSGSSSSPSKVSSPRPVSRSTAPAAAPKSQGFQSRAAGPGGNADKKKTATTAKPPTQEAPVIPPVPPPNGGAPVTGAPNNPNSSNNPNLPADSVQASRGERRTLMDALQEPGANRSAQKYRGTVLSSVYKLPTNPANTAKTLQQFNGPRGQRMTLGA